ncbi:heat shock 70 kDa protein 12A [Oceanobacillus picturae]|uniref:Heat shock 70 kDa protein 12A n=1 Tax=Oceanobacillus picturae TaxID=171693 RepID=A0A0U9HZB9_9BACI|nr:hypothetical protein [Oceanobacillus picturae]GAQ17901.1 heat shock 70 kDa protein 12A [Oceanobacillus picturae]
MKPLIHKVKREQVKVEPQCLKVEPQRHKVKPERPKVKPERLNLNTPEKQDKGRMPALSCFGWEKTRKNFRSKSP